MNIVFLVGRITHYRLLGPIIDEALRRGCDVECWHDYSWPRDGAKGYQFPAVEEAPRFVHGVPRFRVYQGTHDPTVQTALRDCVVVSLKPPDAVLGPAATPSRRRPFWVLVQYAIDTFLTCRPEQLLACDAIAFYSDWWIDWAIEHYASKGMVSDREFFARDLRAKGWIVGLPALDATSLIDPEEVRSRWGLPPDRPVITHLPFGGVGTTSLWPRQIFGEPRRWRQILYSAAEGRPDYWRDILHGWNDAGVMRSIRAFCDRNGACLLVKSRLKTPIPSHTATVADKCVHDERHYPATILEAMAVSDLCISFYSATVLEAAFAKTAHLCVAYDIEDYWGDERSIIEHEKRLFNTHPGGMFNFTGVTQAMSIPEAISLLPLATLSTFSLDTDARSRYVRKYVGFDDRSAARRLLEALEREVTAGSAQGARA